jgi:hypothetical protein
MRKFDTKVQHLKYQVLKEVAKEAWDDTLLRNFLNKSSKWSVIIGYDDQGCKWSDIAHGGAKSQIEAELVVSTFA